jgi:hypothetical protein
VCHGNVSEYSAENDMPGQRPWGIKWDDGHVISYNRNDMMRYCLGHVDGSWVERSACIWLHLALDPRSQKPGSWSVLCEKVGGLNRTTASHWTTRSHAHKS